MRTSYVLAVVGLSLGFSPVARAEGLADRARAYTSAHVTSRALVPPFSRQTGLACSACHYQFLSLTPFGREFKQNGYTMTAQKAIDDKKEGKLNLSPIAGLGTMVQASYTHVSSTIPGTQNNSAALPQQLSIFLAGMISSKIGIFSQVTYSGADGSVGIDNIDLRYANQADLGSTALTYGFTLNNNPTISDLWNTTPAWGFPYAGSDVAPSAAAATLIDGGLAQQALGLTGYAIVGGTVYGELGVYRSAFQGQGQPDATSSNTIDGGAPYWRLSLQKKWEKTYLMVGTFGLHASLFPSGVSGATDKLTDMGVDAQWEQQVGTGNLVARGTYIHEARTLDGSVAAGTAANASGNVSEERLNASYYPNQAFGVTLGVFQTTGSTDALLYASGPVTGSLLNDPKTSGFIGEFDFNAWQNTRLGLQYTAYSNFNGASNNYDGAGRNASGNNTLYFLVWVVF